MNERDIMTSKVHERNDKHTAFANSACDLPNLDKFNNSQVSIPVGWWITHEDREYIVVILVEKTIVLGSLRRIC